MSLAIQVETHVRNTGSTTTHLYYGHQFIGSLHAMNSRLQTRVLACYTFIRYYNAIDSF